MEEGTLAKWHVRKGDRVRSGDIIAEIETDKATMEVEAVDEGTIGEILVPEGAEHIPVNKPIALLLTDGEDAPSASPLEGEVAAQRAAGEGSQSTIDSGASSPRPSPHRGEGVTATPRPSPQPPPYQGGEDKSNGHAKRDHVKRVLASPLARRLARQRGIDLGGLRGSGPKGRIVKRDISVAAPEAHIPEQAEAIEAVEARAEPEHRLTLSRTAPPEGLTDKQVLALYEPGSYELLPHDTMRRVIAERLTLAKQTIPHFYLGIDCELDAVLAARTRLNGMAPQDGPRSFKLSVNDFIIKALAMALQKVPRANASWTEEGLLLHRGSDISVAVALPGGGLFTPVVRNAELKSLSEISNEMRDLAGRARSKRLAPHEYQGGTTTLSNLGMYGIDRFDAVINPPQASILAVGRAEKRPVIKDDAVKIATMMSATLSVDHRVIDGALGAELLAAFKAFIEDPVTMLV
jgi:pyruvate dehydrogenase E2 component (dihydrolipoyllysine-residue acetyltransferase)